MASNYVSRALRQSHCGLYNSFGRKFSTVSCCGWEYVECIGVDLRFASVIPFFSVRSCFGLCLNFVLGAMPRWLGAAVNGNFMTSLTLITSIKLSCRTHVVDCTFMCLLGNLNLLRCLFVLRPVFSSPIRQIYERRESLSLSWRSANTSYWYYNVMQYGQRGHTSQLLTKNYQWTELDVISNSNYVVPREREWVYCAIFAPNGLQSIYY